MKGHMSQTRKNKGKLRKKEPTPNLIGKEIEKEYFPEQSKTQTNLYYTKIIDTTGLTAMDLSCVNNYEVLDVCFVPSVV